MRPGCHMTQPRTFHGQRLHQYQFTCRERWPGNYGPHAWCHGCQEQALREEARKLAKQVGHKVVPR